MITSLRTYKDELRSYIREYTEPCAKLGAIDRVATVTEADFLQYAYQGTPFIFPQGAKDWPLTTGGSELFYRLCGNSPLKVRYGDYSRGNSAFQTYMTTVAEFHESFAAKDGSEPEYAGFQKPSAQLLKLVHYPLWLETNYSKDPFHYWFGPAGTYTALHSDTPDKLVYQCFGKKRWHLIAPQYHDDLDIDPDFGRGYDTSPFDPRITNAEQMPHQQDIKVHTFELAEGDLFFLPGGWYHAIEALTESLSFEYKSDPIPYSITNNDLKQRLLNQYQQNFMSDKDTV